MSAQCGRRGLNPAAFRMPSVCLLLKQFCSIHNVKLHSHFTWSGWILRVLQTQNIAYKAPSNKSHTKMEAPPKREQLHISGPQPRLLCTTLWYMSYSNRTKYLGRIGIIITSCCNAPSQTLLMKCFTYNISSLHGRWAANPAILQICGLESLIFFLFKFDDAVPRL